MLPLHPENQEVELFGDEMNQEVILSIIFAGIGIWIAGETEKYHHELQISYQSKNYKLMTNGHRHKHGHQRQ